MEIKMVKQFFVAVAFVLVVSPAIAGNCPSKVAEIDAALSSGSVPAKNIEDVTALRNKGDTQHKEGDHSDSVVTLNLAMELAGLN